ncbi:MAG TPA: RDD family protein [Acidobacteriaceae bacterium]
MSPSSSKLDINLAPRPDLENVPAWKHELNERLQATRARRTRRVPEQDSLPMLEHFDKNESRASRLAAKVAERYANAPSYSEILAAEARAAAEVAEAAAAAARQASDAAQALLAGLEAPGQMRRDAAAASAQTQAVSRPEIASTPQSSSESERTPSLSPGRTCESAAHEPQHPTSAAAWEGVPSSPACIAFDPVQEAIVSPAQPLPVNLIEFPRQLVAPRKARPRLEEGPLRESLDENGSDQLRIFEAETANIATTIAVKTAVPEWTSIRLEAKSPSMLVDDKDSSSLQFPLKTAPLEDRLMAGIVDAALVFLAFVLFVLVFVSCTAHPPMGKAALLSAGLVLGGLFLAYQYLFFRFTEGTPGMRYAKIALCTFEDENPTRKAMRRRIPFLLLSAAPLGLGFAWAWFDADRLGWHDRITRMYQRSYR